MRLVLLLSVLCAMPVVCSAAEVKTLGWVCHDYDMPYMRKVITMAPGFGVNHIQIDQFLPKHGTGLPTTQQQTEDLNELATLCKENGVELFMWEREINGCPQEFIVDGKVDLDNDGLWQWMTAKYEKLFATIPNLSGIFLTLRESNVHIQDSSSVKTEMDESERVAKLVGTVEAVCKKLGKKVFVRDFSVEPGEMQNIVDAVAAMPEDVCVMTKGVARDWHPYLPNNPAFGKYGSRDQIAEIDLASEYNGQNTIPYIIAPELEKRWKNAKSKGAVGAAGRIDRFDAHAIDTLNEANLYIFTSMIRDGMDAESATRKYCADRFGEGCADVLAECLLRTYDLSNAIYYTKRHKFINCHSTVPDIGYADSHIDSQSLAIWIPSEAKTREELKKPTRAVVDEVLAEKDKAVRLAEQNLSDLDTIKDKMTPQDFQWVRAQFEKTVYLAKLWRPMAVAFMSARLCLWDPSEGNISLANEWLGTYREAIDSLEANYGPGFTTGNKIKGRNQTIPRARTLADQIEQRIKECGNKEQTGKRG